MRWNPVELRKRKHLNLLETVGFIDRFQTQIQCQALGSDALIDETPADFFCFVFFWFFFVCVCSAFVSCQTPSICLFFRLFGLPNRRFSVARTLFRFVFFKSARKSNKNGHGSALWFQGKFRFQFRCTPSLPRLIQNKPNLLVFLDVIDSC